MREKIFAAMSLAIALGAGCATSASRDSTASAASSSAAAPDSDHLIESAAPFEPSADAPAVPTPAPSAPPVGCAARVGTDRLRRSAIKRTVDAGLGRWLQTVSVDPLLARGRFQGWIIRSLDPSDRCYAGVDLRAGDVVTRVNGRLVEHPEEALDVWTKLPSSPELVIDFLRDGEARRVRFGIVDP